MSAFMIINIEIKDLANFRSYLEKSKVIATKFGAKLLYRGAHESTLAGEGPKGPLAIVVEFPSVKNVREWHQSPEYQDIIALREASSIQSINTYSTLTGA